MMHRLGIVPQRLLREPFRVAALERALGPRIPIRMQRYAFDPQAIAPLLELRRSPARTVQRYGNSQPVCGRRRRMVSTSTPNLISAGLMPARPFNFLRE